MYILYIYYYEINLIIRINTYSLGDEPMVMTTVSKWGNSLALRIPHQIAQELGVVENSSVNLDIENGRLCIRRAISMDDMINSINPGNLHRELAKDFTPQGKELL